MYLETECPKDGLIWRLVAEHTRRKDGNRICTLCGMKIKDHFKPWPVTFPTLVLTCAGSPVKL